MDRENEPPLYVAYGPAFSGAYESYAEAEKIVTKNNAGAVYRRLDLDFDFTMLSLDELQALLRDVLLNNPAPEDKEWIQGVCLEIGQRQKTR